ncbi:protein phosphatase 2A structural subunit [Tieghemiomyces parasiticus]|uniref:Protein phosphatase 2A structural subunit n=1 Tax=Tieghemiomyces parasiticus TaxID=78921 RepID=A0A9W8AN58_9FUNG|nr:protein phosphatase 2A structural subunit [Tieghemiomyces parasiticus]KAJ1930585.1 protein phosphatase 2A structural subunit [Tieghemiomyces parasiticus]
MMNPEMSENSLYPIAVLLDELKHDDLALRLNAIRRLSTIAQALGPERTRNELIPFLDEAAEDEDEILLAIAEELGNFVDNVGGPEYATVLLHPLGNLASVEETVVREKAVASLNHIGTVLSPAQLESDFIPLLKRLHSAEWFTNRASAAGLFAVAYARVNPALQAEMRQAYGQLCQDPTPMVRRVAAARLSEFVRQLQPEFLIEAAVPYFNCLSVDDQDSVRLLTVEPLVTISSALTTEQVGEFLLAAFRALAVDKSWRVRYMVADKFVELTRVMAPHVAKEEVVAMFVSFLKDGEAEVRTIICSQIPGFCELVGREDVLEKIYPHLKELVSDPAQPVRSAFATHVSGLAPLFEKEATHQYLLPLFLRLLKDDFSEVRLNIISRLDKVNAVIGIELLSDQLLPAIMELAEDKQWRVRLAIIEYIPLLAKQLGVAFFDEQLTHLCMSWLGDRVFSIREAATRNLKNLTDVFGAEWAKGTIIPKILGLANHPNYLYRMTTIFALTTIVPSVTPEVIRASILPAIESLVTDDIPNIRFNVAKSIEALAPVLQRDPELRPLVPAQIVPALTTLTQDPDQDVRYYAQRALQTVQNPVS